MNDKFSNIASILALWGSVGVTITGICVAVVKYKQWQKSNTSEFKKLRSDVDELMRGHTSIKQDYKEEQDRWKSAMTELTDWVKWMFEYKK